MTKPNEATLGLATQMEEAQARLSRAVKAVAEMERALRAARAQERSARILLADVEAGELERGRGGGRASGGEL